MDVESLNLEKVRKAIIYATEKNPDSLNCEIEFTERLKLHPEILEARLHRIKHILRQLKFKPDNIIADLGCGIGINSVLCVVCGIKKNLFD